MTQEYKDGFTCNKILSKWATTSLNVEPVRVFQSPSSLSHDHPFQFFLSSYCARSHLSKLNSSQYLTIEPGNSHGRVFSGVPYSILVFFWSLSTLKLLEARLDNV